MSQEHCVFPLVASLVRWLPGNNSFLVQTWDNIMVLDGLSVVVTVSRTGSISFAHLRSIWVTYKCETGRNIKWRGSDRSHDIQ